MKCNVILHIILLAKVKYLVSAEHMPGYLHETIMPLCLFYFLKFVYSAQSPQRDRQLPHYGCHIQSQQ